MVDQTTFLSDGELYDLIVDVVGDDTSLEFCALSEYYIDDTGLDAAMRLYGVGWDDMQELLGVLENRDVWLVCYENTEEKICHRTTLVDELASMREPDRPSPEQEAVR